ncbi:helix-turn-helix transcriptional regulator [Microvirga sp. STS02]|uniref:helix-turn-helix transcriptional regulator n=1 Tax=Hymenobacter negativus TaxID=2795026 RepID=UPI0018DB4970|nr:MULTISPECIES: helix-turn-helix transcriptional regulator [Bacteria]MBH8569496.1 helix-turn-helix transcriptional regulator [Hymenobacter negativus]MBR7209232.1 helix-turn-helix transcriptional regulator [Microvirga sp. STS02]
MVAHTSESIDQRFAQLIKQFGLTKNSFAISLGKTASVVQHLIDGRNKPGYDLLCKVFEIYPNVSRDWLLLGRGPMLVSGEHATKAVAPPTAPALEAPFEPIDLSDVEVRTARRSGPGVAGSRLQPDEIATTLALAAAANQPVRAVVATARDESRISPPVAAVAAAETPVATNTATAPEVPVAPVAPAAAAEAAPIASPRPEPAAAPVAALPSPVPVPATPAPGVPSPEVYVAAALHAQNLQHQLALAEMRNQHLLEQQQMLREMLAMARQSMV